MPTKCWLETLMEETFERPRHRWEDNIKVDLRQLEFARVGWTNLTQDRDRCNIIQAFVGIVKSH
jgi:hypothetical protein